MIFLSNYRLVRMGILLTAGLLSTLPAAAQIERINLGPGGVQANADSYSAVISDDGNVIAFRSNADNLIASDTNGWADIFVSDGLAGTLEVASLQPDGSETQSYSTFPAISDDGQIIVYEGRDASSSIAWTAVYDRTDNSVTQLLPRDNGYGSSGPNRARLEPSISGNGEFIAFHSLAVFDDLFDPSIRPIDDDNNNADDVFVFDISTQPSPQLERISRNSSGNEGRADSLSATLSDNGRWVAFYSYADDLVANDLNSHEDIFVRDRDTDSTELISATPTGLPGNGPSYNPVISGNGQYVAFRSRASDLVSGDSNEHWDIFVRNRNTASTERISVSSNGTEANHDSFEASISDDGRFVVFRSMASNLVVNDSNNRADIFVHDRVSGLTKRVSLPASGQSDGHSFDPAISGDGTWIVFESDAGNLVPADSNRARDVFRVANPLIGSLPPSNQGDNDE